MNTEGDHQPPATLQQFVEVLTRSRLLDDEQIAEAVAVVDAEQKKTTPEAERLASLRDQLVVTGVLSAWQCEKLSYGRWRGFFLADYVLVALIQKKATTNTYLASDRRDGSRVVLEVDLRPNNDRDAADGWTRCDEVSYRPLRRNSS